MYQLLKTGFESGRSRLGKHRIATTYSLDCLLSNTCYLVTILMYISIVVMFIKQPILNIPYLSDFQVHMMILPTYVYW